MRINVIKQVTATLEHSDLRLVLACLDYCAHRLRAHPKSGIQRVVSPGAVDAFRAEIRNALSPQG
jgi:hypothetical protein